MAYTITQNDIDNLIAQNVDLTVNDFEVYLNQIIAIGDELVATCQKGYKFFTTQSWLGQYSIYFGERTSSGSSNFLRFTMNDDLTVGTCTFTENSIPYESFTVETEVIEPKYIITEEDLLKFVNSNSELLVNGVLVDEGFRIFEGDSLRVNCFVGYEFFYDGVNPLIDSSVYFQGRSDSGSNLYLNFDLEESKTVAYSIMDNNSYNSIEVSTLQTTETLGSNNVYLINEDELNSVNSERFVSGGDTVFDYGKFILSVLEFPFSIDESLILEPEKIRLGNLETSIESPKISTDKILVDLGEISISSTYGDLRDYKNTIALIHLPRTESIALDVDYVIDETIHIEYIIDCYTGIATVNIYSSKIEGVITTKQVDIGVNIPYAIVTDTATINNSNVDVGGDNGVKIPYIELIKQNATLPNGVFTIPIIDESIINVNTGFIRVEEIQLETNAKYNEKDAILSILKSGIIIKG